MERRHGAEAGVSKRQRGGSSVLLPLLSHEKVHSDKSGPSASLYVSDDISKQITAVMAPN